MDLKERTEEVRSFFHGKRVLITGGAGFMGSHLADRLLGLGAHVRIFDIYPPHIKDLEFYPGDIRDLHSLKRATRGMDIVFHFSALLGVERILSIPDQVMEVNLQGARKCLLAAAQSGVERFIFASSSEVYGEPRHVPISEEDAASPISVYGVSKMASETYCRIFSEKHSLPTIILRFFNVYGPRQKEMFVMSRFIARVSQGMPPLIYGSGDQSRSYTFITDAINGTLLASAYENGSSITFNIGNDEEVTLNRLAAFIIELSRRKLVPEYRSFGDGIRVEKREILRRQPDISKAKGLLGFQILTPFQEGISRYYEWFLKDNKIKELREEIYRYELSLLRGKSSTPLTPVGSKAPLERNAGE